MIGRFLNSKWAVILFPIALILNFYLWSAVFLYADDALMKLYGSFGYDTSAKYGTCPFISFLLGSLCSFSFLGVSIFLGFLSVEHWQKSS